MRTLLLLSYTLILQSSFGQKPLQIYGGENHDIYLGCLNCSDVALNSIWNEVGKYGSNVSSLSIWDEVGQYGSEVSSYSPWNNVASYPPVIVDNDGNFYGYFTVNESKSQRAESNLVLTLYKYHDLIKNDVDKWYNKLFK